MTRHKRARVGLFVSGGTYAYQVDLIFGAHEECERRGLDLICLAGGSLGWADPRNYCYEVASPADLDAAILVPGTWGAPLDSAPVQELLQRYTSLPCCIIGARHADLPSVCIDNVSGVREMTRHLLEVHQRKRVAFIAGSGLESVQRQQGYEAALRAAGIEPDPALIFAGNYTAEMGREAVLSWHSEGKLACDGIIAANDWMASGALEVLQELGFRVPEDVALVGFDDIDRACFMSPPLTTIRQPPQFLGTEAVILLDGLLSGQTIQRHVEVATLPQIRRSCGCFGHTSSLRAVTPLSGDAPPLSVARARIAAELVDVAGSLASGLTESWAERLIEALEEDLTQGSERTFLDALARLIASTAARGNITAWHHVVALLREESLPGLANDVRILARADTLFGRAHITIGEQAELAQGRRLLALEDVVLRLEDAARDARTALDWPALRGVIAEHLPRFRIPRCYVAMGDGGADSVSRQMFAYDGGRERELPEGGIPFRTSQIIAPEVSPEARTTLIMHALFMQQEIIGHACFALGPKDGSVFKTLSDVMSSSLKAARMSEALIEEATKRERAERSRMLQELEIAARIQVAILPKQPAVPGLELATAMRPATEVGGDYFDILPCPGGCWMGIGDVAGHGLTAGVVMLMIQSIVAATVYARPELGPVRAWQALNAILSDNIRQRMEQDEHATLSLIRYRDTGRLTFAGAHEELFIYRKALGRCERVPTPGVWVGVWSVADEDTPESECWLAAGDVLLLYTDGILEARATSGEPYGSERLEALLTSTGELPVQAICDAIMNDVSEWMGTQDDDMTVVVARHIGAA